MVVFAVDISRPHAQALEPVQDRRIYIEVISGARLFGDQATPAEYGAGLKFAIDKGWLELHESGAFVKLTQAGSDMFS
jgi:hypothetical protein